MLLFLHRCIRTTNDVSSFSSSQINRAYSDDLRNPQSLDAELDIWQCVWNNMNDRPSTILSTIKQTDKALFPNIYAMLKILCTLPVTTCECEHFRRLKRHSLCASHVRQEHLKWNGTSRRTLRRPTPGTLMKWWIFLHENMSCSSIDYCGHFELRLKTLRDLGLNGYTSNWHTWQPSLCT